MHFTQELSSNLIKHPTETDLHGSLLKHLSPKSHSSHVCFRCHVAATAWVYVYRCAHLLLQGRPPHALGQGWLA